MLQIANKTYFDTGDELHETTHRRVLYTNRLFVQSDPLELPVGKLLPADSIASTTGAVALETTESMPVGGVLVATGGDQLVDEIADVLSFATNSVFTRDVDLVRRLVTVPRADGRFPRDSAGALFRGTFDTGVPFTATDLQNAEQLLSCLLAFVGRTSS